jgi:alpha-ketoglutarate-dependent taurine dioxygenase
MKKKSQTFLNSNFFTGDTKKNIENIKKKYLDNNRYHLIIRNFEKNKKKINSKIIKLSKLMGKPLPQNKIGKKYVVIKPNVKLIEKKYKNKSIKLRYHQTNIGGAIHSDGPQLSEPPRYVIMGCIKQAKKGGSSIISSTKKIYEYLKKNNPKILNTLTKKFYFERRGFNFANNNIFKKSIFENKSNNFRFRYLREYIEAAYNLKKIKLNPNEIKALNYLDKLLSQKKFQDTYKLNEGDVIILNNNVLAHGRSGFKLNSGKQRSLIRIWVK